MNPEEKKCKNCHYQKNDIVFNLPCPETKGNDDTCPYFEPLQTITLTKQPDNLMDGLLSEITRVNKIIAEYKSLPKGAGMFAAGFMLIDINAAEKAIADGDTVKMIIIYKKLKEWEQ